MASEARLEILALEADARKQAMWHDAYAAAHAETEPRIYAEERRLAVVYHGFADALMAIVERLEAP